MNEKTNIGLIIDYLNQNNSKYSLKLTDLTPEQILSLSSVELTDALNYIMNAGIGLGCVVAKTTTLFDGLKELHHHDFYEILYIKKGNFTFKADDKIYSVKPGDMVLVTPSTLHVLEQVPNSECERVVINVTEKYIDKLSTSNTDLKKVFKYIEETKNYLISFQNETQKKVENYLDILCSTLFSDKYGEDLLFKIKFTQLMLLINSNFDSNEDADISSENETVAKAIEFINKNIDNSFTIDDIADYANVSPSTISHTFKSQTGISIYKFVTKKRMILAKSLIKKNISFNQIYTMCGFNDYTSFFRAFKKEWSSEKSDCNGV